MKILGVNLDTGHNFNKQESALADKGSSRLPIVKAVSGPKGGFSKEDRLLTFKAFIPPVFSFGGPVWFPIRSKLKGAVKRLQTIQNNALRAVTGCHAAASFQHVHDECKVLPVREHIAMQCTQFLVNSRQAMHPSNEVTGRPPGARPDMKPTLQHCFAREAVNYTTDGAITEMALKRAIKDIHTKAVTDVRAKSSPNRVLGVPPPEVHPSEASLPQCYRDSLSQLRSDYCQNLQSYQKFINNVNDDNCPSCQSSPHTTSHLFSCQAAPTPLKPIDLWERPREAAFFISSLPCFAHLPPLNPPLPPPPPEPPP